MASPFSSSACSLRLQAEDEKEFLRGHPTPRQGLPPLHPASSRLQHHLINVTPEPIFAGLERLHQRMVSRMEVPASVLILRRVTTANVSTGEAEAQMYPGITRFQTILTATSVRRDLTYLAEMRT
jgi:hypothetical protein